MADRPVKFMCASKELTLIRVPRKTFRVEDGPKQEDYETGTIYTPTPDVVGGTITAVPGEDLLPTGPGNAEEDKITWLRRQPEFGTYYHEMEEFAPDPSDLLVEIAKAAGAKDVVGLGEIYEAEEADWARPQILEAALESLKAIDAAESVKT